MKLASLLVAAALATLDVSVAHAGLLTYTTSTAGGPTFARPLEDLSGPSAAGAAARYSRYTFTVGTSGDYSVLTTGTYDTFSVLYSPSFAPAASLTNAKVANDDLVMTNGSTRVSTFTTSGLSYALVAGTSYTVVTTGFSSADAGFASITIGGAGAIVPSAPVPADVAPPANIVTLTGNTTTGATFNRPVEDLSSLSSVGTAVRYGAYGFRVDTAGTYSFLSTGEFDTYQFLYAGAFDPTRPLGGARVANDDSDLGIGTSAFAYDLLAGVDYTLLMTGYANGDFGAFSTTIGGPGAVRLAAIVPPGAVPEPGLLALLAGGLGVMGVARRRRTPPLAA